MTRTKAVSLVLTIALLLTLVTVTQVLAGQPLALTVLPELGSSTAATSVHLPIHSPIIACDDCSGGGSSGG